MGAIAGPATSEGNQGHLVRVDLVAPLRAES